MKKFLSLILVVVIVLVAVPYTTISSKAATSVNNWPGQPMDAYDSTRNIYYFDIPLEYNYFIFSDGNYYNGQNNGIAWQTEDIAFTSNKLYSPNLSDTSYTNGATKCSVSMIDYNQGENSRRVYFETPLNWETPSCYCWASIDYVFVPDTNSIPSDAYEFNGHYYKVYSDICSTWANAKTYCESLGGHLATITSSEENNAVYSYMTSAGYKNAYLGLHDSETEGQWKWVTNEAVTYTNWHSGEPNSETSTEDYAMFYYKYTNGNWNDGNFSSTVNGEKNFICEWDSNDSEIQSDYIDQHLNFVNSHEYKNLITNASFYNNIMKGEKSSVAAAYGVWEYAEDIGEIASLKFDDLMVSDNPYDIILSDLFTQYSTMDNFSSATKVKILEYANFSYDTLMKTLKSRKEWDNDYTKELELEIKGIVFDPDYKVKDTHAFEVIKSTLNGLIKDEKLESIFIGLKRADTIYEYIGNATDVVDNFIKAYNAYVAAMGYIEAKDSIVSSLINSSYEMDPICGALFADSLSDYLAIENEDDAFDFALKEMLSESAWTAYDTIGKKMVQQSAYKFVAEAIGETAGSIGILTFTYNTTYKVLNFITALDAKGDLYKVMYAASKLEAPMLSHTKGLATSLIESPCIDNAMKFDASWGLLQSLESYSYQMLAKYAAKNSLSTRIINFFRKSYISEDMAAPLYLSSVWKDNNCHSGKYNISYKIVSVKCPTDVELYVDGERKLTISDNNILGCEVGFNAMVIGNQKFIAVPIDSEYDIQIRATNDGEMTYNVSEYDSMKLTRYVEYKEIPLVTDRMFYGTINHEFNTEEENYRLESDTEEIHCSFDSIDDEFACILGDVDGDETISIRDATYIQLYIAKKGLIDGDRLVYSDADQDSDITVMDATQIQLFIAQIIPNL